MKNVRISQDRKTAKFFSGIYGADRNAMTLCKIEAKARLATEKDKRVVKLLEYAMRKMVY